MENNMICETCGKEHDGSYGSGRFCSDHCRRIWIGRQSNITMKKNGTKKNNLKNSTIRCKSPHGTWRCEKCNIIFNTRHEMYTHKHSFHPIIKGSSWNKGLTKSTDERVAKYVQTCKERGLYNPATKGKHLSTDVKKKISESCKSFYKNHPELTPYKLHHSSKESYPEKYFRELFVHENITGYVRDLSILGYFLDFGFKDKLIDFEVDGSQHWVDPKIIEHDKIRTKKLEENGWTVIRIRWDDWQKMSDSDKHKWIDNFKSILI